MDRWAGMGGRAGEEWRRGRTDGSFQREEANMDVVMARSGYCTKSGSPERAVTGLGSVHHCPSQRDQMHSASILFDWN